MLTLLLLAVGLGADATVAGLSYPEAATIEGKELKLLGAGLREKWFMDVYALAAYTESGSCDPKKIVATDEVKYMRLDMLRNVGAERMASTIGGSFDEHMPKDAAPELREQRRTFESYFKDELKKGTELEFLYLPGTGMHVRQKGKLLGPPLEGEDFARVFWDIYFGPETCCSDLKSEVLSHCKKR